MPLTPNVLGLPAPDLPLWRKMDRPKYAGRKLVMPRAENKCKTAGHGSTDGRLYRQNLMAKGVGWGFLLQLNTRPIAICFHPPRSFGLLGHKACRIAYDQAHHCRLFICACWHIFLGNNSSCSRRPSIKKWRFGFSNLTVFGKGHWGVFHKSQISGQGWQ